MKLANQVALITGAGSGFGRASAVVFAKEGGKVSVVDVDDKGAQQTVEMVKQNGGEAIFFHADVAKAGDVENVIKTTVKQYGRIDILFNNAGIPMIRTPIEDLEEAVWDRILAVNLKGVFWGCKYAVPFMKKQGGGVIINTASIGGLRPRPALCAYGASKGAVVTFTKGLALELAPYKIRVNCISPVVADTPMKFYDDQHLEEGKKRTLATIPLGRLATAEDVAYAALYLASKEASMVTGISLNVDGGRGV